MKNKYEVTFERYLASEYTDKKELVQLNKYITYATSEKQAINNIKFRNKLKTGCIYDNGITAIFIEANAIEII